MENIEKVAFLVNDPDSAWEGVRSSLGMLVENKWVATFFIDAEVSLPPGKVDDNFLENLEILDDLEGELYTNVQANVDKWGFFKYITLEDMVAKIKEYQLVVPF